MNRPLKRDVKGNILLKELSEVRTWDAKRVKAYRNRLHKYLSYIQTPSKLVDLVFNKKAKTLPDDKVYLERYIKSLNEILTDKNG